MAILKAEIYRQDIFDFKVSGYIVCEFKGQTSDFSSEKALNPTEARSRKMGFI